MTGSRVPTHSGVQPSGVLRGRFVRPLALLAVIWAAACGGDGGTTDPEPAPQPNRPPAASGSIPAQNMTAGESVTVSVGGLFSDPDGDPLTFTAISSNAGVASVALSGTDLTITAVAAGSATVTVTARDPAGLSVAAGANVTVMEPNRAPVPAVPVAPAQTAIVGDTLNVDMSPFFTDPDGDALTYAATSANASVATVTVAGAVVSAAAVGAGSTTLTVTATDPDGLSGSLSVPVTVEPNLPPEATRDSLSSQSIQERNSETVNIAQYFTDPNGQALTYEAESDDAGVATVSVSGGTLTVTAVAIGTATVTVTATDPYGLTASLSGTVTVIERVNQAPEVEGTIRPSRLTVGTSGTLDLEGDSPLFTDPDGDALTYSAEMADSSVASATVTGSVVRVSALTIGATTGTVTATDPGGLSASTSFDLTVIDTAQAIFRDDFEDDSSLSDWDTEGSQAEVSDGTLRLSDTDSTLLAAAEHIISASITSWEVGVSMGQASDSASTALVFSTGDARIQAFRVGIGDWTLNFNDGPVPTNYRFAIYDTEGSQGAGWYYIDGAYGVSELINTASAELTRITVDLTGIRLRVLAGDEAILEFNNLPDWFPTDLAGVGLWMINLRDVLAESEDETSNVNTGLFDWIEVNGVPVEGSSTTGDYRSRAVVPIDVTRDVGVLREASPRVVGESPLLSVTPGRR